MVQSSCHVSQGHDSSDHPVITDDDGSIRSGRRIALYPGGYSSAGTSGSLPAINEIARAQSPKLLVCIMTKIQLVGNVFLITA